MPPRPVKSERPEPAMDTRIAAAVGGHVLCTDETPPFTVTQRIALLVGKEFDSEIGVGRAVELPLNGHAETATLSRGQYREVLQVVGTRIAVTWIVGGRSVRFQINPQACIGEDRVGQDRIAGACRPSAVLRQLWARD